MQDLFGSLAFISTMIGLIPQILKSYKTKSTHDLSLFYLINYLLGSFFWCAHAWQGSFYVFASNVFGLLTCIFLIYLKMKYDSKK